MNTSRSRFSKEIEIDRRYLYFIKQTPEFVNDIEILFKVEIQVVSEDPLVIAIIAKLQQKLEDCIEYFQETKAIISVNIPKESLALFTSDTENFGLENLVTKLIMVLKLLF